MDAATSIETGETEALREPSRQDLFEILSNVRRRYVIRYLLQHDEPVDLRSLSEQVATWETGKPTPEVTAAERHRVYNALQQVHLPKMASAGVIEIERDHINPTDALQEFQVYMEVVPGNDIPWSVYYGGLGVLGLFLTGALALGAYPLRFVPKLVYLALIATILTVSGLVNYYQQRKMRLDVDGDPPDHF
ncbi:MAG: hypothetical protein ABEI77_03885 [Halorientalis sp.]